MLNSSLFYWSLAIHCRKTIMEINMKSIYWKDKVKKFISLYKSLNIEVIKYTAANHSISKRIHRNVLKIVTYNEHPLASQLSHSLQQYWWPHKSKVRHRVCWQRQLSTEVHVRFPINSRLVSYFYPINQLLEMDTIYWKNIDTIWGAGDIHICIQ